MCRLNGCLTSREKNNICSNNSGGGGTSIGASDVGLVTKRVIGGNSGATVMGVDVDAYSVGIVA